jgi:hypothetical protein
MPYLSISLIIQIALVIHAIRNGKNIAWVYFLIFVPLIGSIAYVFVELIPELRSSGHVRRGTEQLGNIVNPGKQTRELESLYEYSPTVENMRNLADEYFRIGKTGDAAELYRRCLSGPLGPDPYTQARLARTLLRSGETAEALEMIQAAEEHAPEDRTAEYALIHGKILEAMERFDEAEAFFRRASERGAEFEYASEFIDYLIRRGRSEEARSEFKTLEDRFRRLPGFSRKLNRSWYHAARDAVQRSGPR